MLMYPKKWIGLGSPKDPGLYVLFWGVEGRTRLDGLVLRLPNGESRYQPW